MTAVDWGPVPGVPMAEQARIVCRHGGGARVHDVDAFWSEMDVWHGASCGPLAPAPYDQHDRSVRPHLGAEAYQREPAAPRSEHRRSRLFHRAGGAWPEWVGRCEHCSRAPRDRRGRRTVRGEHRLAGESLALLLDGAASCWLAEIDLFDLANHGGRGTAEAIVRGRARVAAS
ncbi:hypothetical protein SAMN05216207_104629 [Pseudonocardia ammonioxydans]|uniref:Uncharacterized protein n=1 Tax=Pseudonocardia ammonioxydans TaxID=260086 RepID=A0A1I5GFW7_PSUAM|nr:hypothetical protein [Pseudonocardia ammonioxydans]SFO34789.1 hypothetical protein SAMN05216207_104629 [Pseudonocardia ammonioxydans]